MGIGRVAAAAAAFGLLFALSGSAAALSGPRKGGARGARRCLPRTN